MTEVEIGRRAVIRTSAVAAMVGTGVVAGVTAGAPASLAVGAGDTADSDEEARRVPSEVDYVVIGSGPGGGPVAANLAEAGYTVLVLEAGPPHGNKMYYDVPTFHTRASMDPAIRWDYYVRHYTDTARHGSQWVPNKGILYPRASTLGGCTAHNALITIYPEHSDWRHIQQLTGDAGWDPNRMWGLWERMHAKWQPTATSSFLLGIKETKGALLNGVMLTEIGNLPGGLRQPNPFNLNARTNVDLSAQGVFTPPLSVFNGRRHSVRERLLAVAAKRRNLHLLTNALAERVVLEPCLGGGQRAVAVEYLYGRHLYAACPDARPRGTAERKKLRRHIKVRREVIVAGGAYNSPQLLMLSGIGPAAHLAEHGIDVKIDLPGVGTNLQDRYEVPIVTKTRTPFPSVAHCPVRDRNDPCLDNYLRSGRSNLTAYTSNGFIAAIKSRYSHGRPETELFCAAVLSDFRGYIPRYDEIGLRDRSHYTMLVLKGYSESRAGTVRLRSADPTVMPLVNKRNFNDGAGGQRDVDAILESVAMARRINRKASLGSEVWPGPRTDTRAELERWVRREAWGHHASCTNPIGPVLDAELRVRGTQNLRVVDASAFPRIPGLFLWLPTALLSEKASLDILRDADKVKPRVPR